MPGNVRATAYTLFAIWLIAIATAFWWFQFRFIGSFSNSLATFDGQSLRALDLRPGHNKTALVVHFTDPQCPCTRFSKEHIQDLEATYSAAVEFRHWDAADTVPTAIIIPASPAVAIWADSGELAYFGPYSSGAVCGEGDDFVASILTKLNNGDNPAWINQDAVGCFCPWNKPTEVVL